MSIHGMQQWQRNIVPGRFGAWRLVTDLAPGGGPWPRSCGNADVVVGFRGYMEQISSLDGGQGDSPHGTGAGTGTGIARALDTGLPGPVLRWPWFPPAMPGCTAWPARSSGYLTDRAWDGVNSGGLDYSRHLGSPVRGFPAGFAPDAGLLCYQPQRPVDSLGDH